MMGQVGSRRSISALPDQMSISSSLTNLVFLTNLYPRNSDRKMGMSMYGGMNDLALKRPGKNASKPLKKAMKRQILGAGWVWPLLRSLCFPRPPLRL